MSNVLSQRHKDIADAIVGHPELSYREIGEKFGVSRQRVGKIASDNGIDRPPAPDPKPKGPERECRCCGEAYFGEADTCGAKVCREVVAQWDRLDGSNQEKAYRLRTEGRTWNGIARELGYSYQSAAVRAAHTYAEAMDLPWPPQAAEKEAA